MSAKIRLQVALAQLGFASRRSAVGIVQAGRVKVNGQPTFEPGARVDLAKDSITVDDKKGCVQDKIYLVLNKPKGVVSTVKDKYARRTVLDLVKQKPARLYPVGRLDKDTSGLILLTNDGKLAHRLIHPKFAIKKIYRVCVQGSVCTKTLKELMRGIFLEGKKTFPCKIRQVAFEANDNGQTYLEIELSEGRKRQIKKMFAYFGHHVLAIERIAFGPLCLRELRLRSGKWRLLDENEIAQLKKAAGGMN